MKGRLAPEFVYVLTGGGNRVELGPLVSHAEAEARGIPQACVYVALVNGRGQIFIQHRSARKRLWPNRKTISASGHVEFGESFEMAAERELFEELAIRNTSFTRVGGFHRESHCGPVYEAVTDEEPRPNPTEIDVEQSQFFTVPELQELLGQPNLVTPSGRKALEIWMRNRQGSVARPRCDDV